MARKKSRGRQKIKIAKMKNESHLQVTFSKRRSNLIKTANDLSTLTGAEIALVVFSPGNKPFSFGTPSVKTIINRYKTETPRPQAFTPTERLLQLHRLAEMEKLNSELALLQKQLEEEKKRGETMDDQMEKSKGHCSWWEGPIQNLDLDQLEKLKRAMEDLRRNVWSEFDNRKNQETQKGPSFQQQQICESHQIENPYEYVPAFADSGVPGNGLGFSQHGEGPSISGGGFGFTPEASSGSSGGMQLNLSGIDEFESFVVPDNNAYNHGYDPHF